MSDPKVTRYEDDNFVDITIKNGSGRITISRMKVLPALELNEKGQMIKHLEMSDDSEQ